MGCHCRADRSFYYKGHKFPVCARCTGVLCGMLAGLVLLFFVKPSLVLCLVLAIPAVADGSYQKVSGRESTNARRLITGVLLGYAIFNLIFKFLAHAYAAGRLFEQKYIEKQ